MGMDIGGCDLQFSVDQKEAIYKAIQDLWPQGVMESAKSIPISSTVMSSPQGELLLYQDRDAYESWTKHGETEENRDSLINLLWSVFSTTVVVGSPNHPLLDLLAQRGIRGRG